MSPTPKSIASTLLSFILTLAYPNLASAIEGEHYEASGAYSVRANVLLAGRMSRSESGMKCYFSLSSDLGESWTSPDEFRHSGFKIAGNPTVAVDGNGTLYRMCMSVQPDYSAGVLDLSKSRDDGKTWSSWKTVQSRKGKIADKPRLATDNSNRLALSFTDMRVSKATYNPKSNTTILLSSDQGNSWTPVALKHSAQGQGSHLTFDPKNGALLASWGTYGSGPIRFARIQGRSVVESIVARNSEALVPSTEIHVDSRSGRIVVLWSDTHTIKKPTYFAYSDNNGKSWSEKLKVSETGTLLTGTFTASGAFVFAWTEAVGTGDYVDVVPMFNFEKILGQVTATRKFENNILSESKLISYQDQPTAPAYFGANQTLLNTPFGPIGLLIDWSQGLGRMITAPLDKIR